MVILAKNYKEVLQHILLTKMAATKQWRQFTEHDWAKFDVYAQEYNEKAKIKRIPHLINSTEILLKKIDDEVDLDEDDLSLLKMMQKCKSKSDKKKDKSHHYYVSKKNLSVNQTKKRVREELIDKPENELTEEDKLFNQKLLEKKNRNIKRKVTDSECRAREKFFSLIMKTYVPNVEEIMENICSNEDLQEDVEEESKTDN